MDIDAEADVPPVLRGNSNDPGWKYGKYCDPNNKSKVKCDFCGHISTGGIFRFKQHIASSDNSVKGCKKATPEAIADCKNHFQRVEVTKSKKRQHEQDIRDDVHVSSASARDDVDVVCVGSSSSDPNKLGPMDKFVRPIDGKTSKEEALRQLSMNEALFKERVHQASQYVARWVYTHAIPFNISVGWWKLYGTEVPMLQKMAMRILALTSSSSGCEGNWSVYEMIHTKRRNRLTTDRLNNMVYIQFNTRMLSKRQRSWRKGWENLDKKRKKN